jgi:hypothetical protein
VVECRVLDAAEPAVVAADRTPGPDRTGRTDRAGRADRPTDLGPAEPPGPARPGPDEPIRCSPTEQPADLDASSLPPDPSPADRRVLAGAAVAVWALLIGLTRVWGMYLEATGTRLTLFTPPIIGGYRHQVPLPLVGVAAVGVALALALPAAATRLRWSTLLAAVTASAAGWWIGLALVDGVDGLTRGLHFDQDYADAVVRVADGPGAYLRDYVAILPGEPIALRGHPPGLSMLFGLLHAGGLRGPGWATALVLVTSLSTVPAALILVRCVAGERPARRAAPFLALTPAATWIATSTDGLTMATGTWCLTLLALAGTSPGSRSHRQVLFTVGAGLLAAATALQSYGLVLLAVPALVLAWHQRRWWPLVVAGSVGAATVLALAGWGFSWFAGLGATMHEYQALAVERPYSFFVVGNLGAWALALGPATVAGLALLRHRPTWVVVGGGLAAALLADLSGLSEGEVERIWLPFTVLVLPAAAALGTTRRAASGWLVAQVASAVGLAAVIGANW